MSKYGTLSLPSRKNCARWVTCVNFHRGRTVGTWRATIGAHLILCLHEPGDQAGSQLLVTERHDGQRVELLLVGGAGLHASQVCFTRVGRRRLLVATGRTLGVGRSRGESLLPQLQGLISYDINKSSGCPRRAS